MAHRRSTNGTVPVIVSVGVNNLKGPAMLKFEYEIITMDSNGYSQVRYSCQELGETRVHLFLPFEKGEVAVKAAILNGLPRAWFRAKHRHLISKRYDIRSYHGMTGGFEASIEDDGHHDFQMQSQETVRI